MHGGRKLFDLGRAIDEVVQRFARDRAIDAELVREPHDLGDAPALKFDSPK